jgi:molybdenum cofactor biosynthesis enzyme MoaA
MLVVHLGFACNNACVFCAQGELRARAPVAAEDPAPRLDALAPGDTVAFVGGEPTLSERLPEWIQAAEARGAARIVVQTNGRRLAYRSYAAILGAASPRLSLDVSLHGCTAPMHDYHTATPGSFGQTVKGLANARAEGIPFAITTVITRSSFRHLPEIVRLAGALGARAIQLSMPARRGSAARAADRVLPAAELVAPHLARALAEASATGLGWRSGDHASAPGVAAWFAGLGPVEEVEAAARAARPSPPADGKRRLSLAVQGRPAPGRAEVRAQERRTGAELRPLFPGLFQADDRSEGPAAADGAGGAV